jgi:hypothetical protein
VKVEQWSLIRPSSTFSRWKKREKAYIIIALSCASSRERVPEGRVRGVRKERAALWHSHFPKDADFRYPIVSDSHARRYLA